MQIYIMLYIRVKLFFIASHGRLFKYF